MTNNGIPDLYFHGPPPSRRYKQGDINLLALTHPERYESKEVSNLIIQDLER